LSRDRKKRSGQAAADGGSEPREMVETIEGAQSPEAGEAAEAPQLAGSEEDVSDDLTGEEPGARAAEDAAAESPEAQFEGLEGAPPLEAVVEAVLFAAAEPIQLSRLARLLQGWPKPALGEALAAIAARLEAEGRGLRLIEAAGGWQLRSAPECALWVRRFFTEKPPRLSRPMLETVAIIAYRQPVTRGEIEAIRGVNCDAVLGALVARSLVRICGRRSSPGRPVEYGTTEVFLDLFSLRELAELPPLPDPMALAQLMESAVDENSGEADDGGEVGEVGEVGESREAAEAAEPGGDRLAQGGGGPDSGGAGAGERDDGPGAGDEGGSGPGPDHD